MKYATMDRLKSYFIIGLYFCCVTVHFKVDTESSQKKVVYILTGNYMYVITHIEQKEQAKRTNQMIVFQSLVPINKLFKKER